MSLRRNSKKSSLRDNRGGTFRQVRFKQVKTEVDTIRAFERINKSISGERHIAANFWYIYGDLYS